MGNFKKKATDVWYQHHYSGYLKDGEKRNQCVPESVSTFILKIVFYLDNNYFLCCLIWNSREIEINETHPYLSEAHSPAKDASLEAHNCRMVDSALKADKGRNI